VKLRNSAEAAASLNALRQCGLLTGHEVEVVNRLGAHYSPFDERRVATAPRAVPRSKAETP
jgi:hypothetical protein